VALWAHTCILYAAIFFFNGRRVSKDPENASLINVGEQLQGGPSERGEIQSSPVKVQKGPWRKRRNAIRPFRRPPRHRRRICTQRPPCHHRGTATWGNTVSRSRGSSEAAERVPYTHPVRPGGTEQAAPCRRRRAPEEDVASPKSRASGCHHGSWKMQKGAATSGTAPTPESKKRTSQSRNPHPPSPRLHGLPGLKAPMQPSRCPPPSPPWPAKGSSEPAGLAT
jgi:hypothetical protein